MQKGHRLKVTLRAKVTPCKIVHLCESDLLKKKRDTVQKFHFVQKWRPPNRNIYIWYTNKINLCLEIIRFFLFINLFCMFSFHFLIFCLFFSVTVVPNPYSRSISGSRILLGGFWSSGLWTWIYFDRGWILNVSHIRKIF